MFSNNSIFYTTCNGRKYPITVLGEHSGYEDKDALPEELCIMRAYRESLKGGVEYWEAMDIKKDVE